MLNIKFWEKQPITVMESRSKLSFSIDPQAYSGVEEQVDLKLKRIIGKVGNTRQYLILPDFPTISKEESIALEVAKYKIIELLGVDSNPDSDIFERSKNIALSELTRKIPFERAQILSLLAAYDTAGYGPLSIFIEDKLNIEEIEINSPTAPIQIYHSRYGRCSTNLKFESEADFRHTLNRFIYESEKELNDTTPIIDVQVDDARIHAQLKPFSSNGACASIRVGGRKETNLKTITDDHTTNFETLAFIWLALENRNNIAISGSPGSGKTTFLTSILSLIPRALRIISVEEEVNELKFYSNVGSVVSLYGSKKEGIAIKDQVINALRMRPDMLVIGEIRGEEAKDVFGSANLGIPFLTTMHSNEGGISIIKRLLVRPMSVEPQAISALDISIQMSPNVGERRSIQEINEYCWLSRAETSEEGMQVGDDMVNINSILFNGVLKIKNLNESKVILQFSEKNGLSPQEAIAELKKRALFLKQLCSSTNSTLELIEKINGYGL